MQRPIRPQWLLRQADDLAGRGAGQPRNADLRRAVSASYYALYHHIVLETVWHLMPDCSEDERLRSTRNFAHDGVKQVCQWVTKQPTNLPDEHTVHTIRRNANLLDVAETFPQLWQARVEADYDHLARFTKATVLTRIAMARTMVQKLDAAKGAPAHQAFLAMVAMTARLNKRG